MFSVFQTLPFGPFCASHSGSLRETKQIGTLVTVVPKQPRKKNNYKHKKVFKILNSLEFLVLGAFVSSDVNLFLGIVFADRNIMM